MHLTIFSICEVYTTLNLAYNELFLAFVNVYGPNYSPTSLGVAQRIL